MSSRVKFTFARGPCLGREIVHDFDQGATVAHMKKFLSEEHGACDAQQSLVFVWNEQRLNDEEQTVSSLGPNISINVNVRKRDASDQRSMQPPTPPLPLQRGGGDAAPDFVTSVNAKADLVPSGPAENDVGGTDDLTDFLEWSATPPREPGARKVIIRVEGIDDKLLLHALLALKFPTFQRPPRCSWNIFSYVCPPASLSIRDCSVLNDRVHGMDFVSFIRSLQVSAKVKSFVLGYLNIEDHDLKAIEIRPRQRPEDEISLFTWRWGRSIENYLLPVTAPAALYLRGHDAVSNLTSEVFVTIARHFFPAVSESESKKGKLCGHERLRWNDLIGAGWKRWSSLLQSPDLRVHRDPDIQVAAQSLRTFSITLLEVAQMLVEQQASVYGSLGTRADEWLLHFAGVRRRVRQGDFDVYSAKGKVDCVDWKRVCAAILDLPVVKPAERFNRVEADDAAALWFNLPAVCSFLSNMCTYGAFDVVEADASRVKYAAASALRLVQHALCVLLLGCDPALPAPQITLFRSSDCHCFFPVVCEKMDVFREKMDPSCLTCGRDASVHFLRPNNPSVAVAEDFLVELCRVGSVGWIPWTYMEAVYGRRHLGRMFTSDAVGESHQLYLQHVLPVLYGEVVDSEFTVPTLPAVTVFITDGRVKQGRMEALLEQRRADMNRLCDLIALHTDVPPASAPTSWELLEQRRAEMNRWQQGVWQKYCDEVHSRFSKEDDDVDFPFVSIAEQIASPELATHADCLLALKRDENDRYEVNEALSKVRIFSTRKKVVKILQSLGLARLFKKFTEYPDSELPMISVMKSTALQSLFSIPPESVSDFVKRCHQASISFNPEHERWLKACLILRHCGQGIRPFVAEVTKTLHARVQFEVKQTIERYKELSDSDWTFPKECQGCDNPSFDCRPAELNIVSFDADGAAHAHVAHRLSSIKDEPILLPRACAQGFFLNEDEVFSSSSLFARSFPAVGQSVVLENERRFIMYNLFHSSSDFLQPFEVHTDCRGGITVTAVYCKCIDGGAPSLVNKHLFKTPFPQVQGCQGDLSYKFWTIRLKQPKPDASSPPPQPKYGTSHNTLVTGDIVKLIGDSLPTGLCSTRTYRVLHHTDNGFDLSSVLQPALPPPSSAQSHPPPHALSMNAPKVDQRISILRPETFPLGLFCDAASRYHSLEQSSELSQRWKGIIARKMTTDFGEFAKCFCSKVLREEHQTVRIFETDHSPELLCNMIQFCKAFQCEVFASMYSIPLEKSPCAELHSIHEASMSFKKIRNKICHGDFHTLCEADFETLTNSSRTILEGVLRLSAIMKAQPNVSSDIAASFESIKLAARKSFDEIFGSDQSRHCILSRHMASNILTPDENADMKLMLKNFDLERQQLKAENQSLALQNEDLNAQLEARDQLRFSNLPIVVLEKDVIIRDQIDQQRSENKGKHGGQAVVYQIEFRDEFREEVLMAKIFNSTKDGAWRRELNALNALSDEFIVRVRYVIYASYHEKNRLEPIGYAMEAMACSLQDFAQQNTFQDNSEKYLMLLRQVAKALRFAHSRRFAHLDVNPRNILLDDALNPTVAKLCDFGCAHFMQTRASRLEARGSEYFTAPEFQPGSPAEVDPFPMDIYAFGVVIFTLLHPNAAHLELSSCHDPVIWDKVDICPEFPVISQFRDLGCSCTNRDPRKRPSIQDVTIVLDGLNTAPSLEGMTVSDPAVVWHLKGMSDGAPAFVEDQTCDVMLGEDTAPLDAMRLPLVKVKVIGDETASRGNLDRIGVPSHFLKHHDGFRREVQTLKNALQSTRAQAVSDAASSDPAVVWHLKGMSDGAPAFRQWLLPEFVRQWLESAPSFKRVFCRLESTDDVFTHGSNAFYHRRVSKNICCMV
jgi:serine/threonine protein kinase